MTTSSRKGNGLPTREEMIRAITQHAQENDTSTATTAKATKTQATQNNVTPPWKNQGTGTQVGSHGPSAASSSGPVRVPLQVRRVGPGLARAGRAGRHAEGVQVGGGVPRGAPRVAVPAGAHGGVAAGAEDQTAANHGAADGGGGGDGQLAEAVRTVFKDCDNGYVGCQNKSEWEGGHCLKLSNRPTNLYADLLLPHLKWHPGKKAQAVRTAAASCLWSLLSSSTGGAKGQEGAGSAAITAEQLLQVTQALLPSMNGLVEDGAEQVRIFICRSIR